jgi:type I restriction enzyme M protein
MLGAIIGDIVGSIYAFNNVKTKEFPLFSKSCTFTDDSILTIAIGMALIHDDNYFIQIDKGVIKWMRFLGKKFPNAGFGNMFYDWLFSEKPTPYESYGNGAGMRVSACGIVGKNLDEVKLLSHAVTKVTHNHPESFQAAEAIATSVYLLRQGKSKVELKKHIQNSYYSLDFTLDSIRESYRFTERAIDSTPEAIMAFLESTSFEDAIRNAISIGGDSDTIAAMTGALAAEHYGIPEFIQKQAIMKLDSLMANYLKQFMNDYPLKINKNTK